MQIFRAFQRKVILFFISTPFLFLTTRVVALEVKQFYGAWIPTDQEISCSDLEFEGPYFIIDPDTFYTGFHDACTDAKLWVHEDRLRVVASCSGAEVGFESITKEIELLNKDTIKENGVTYSRCKFPKWWYSSNMFGPGPIKAPVD